MRRLVVAVVMLATLVVSTLASGSVAAAPELRVSDFRVSVQFDGMPQAFFRSVSGLKVEMEVIEFREGGTTGAVRKLMGVTKWPNIVLKQGFTGSPTLLQQWAFRVASGQGQPERRNGVIVIYDDKLNPLARYSVINAWPAKWEAPELDASKNELAIESVEIAHEGLQMTPNQ